MLSTDVYRRVVAAKMYIDHHAGGQLDLDQLSRQACLSRFHFHRLFTRIYRRTPLDYLTQVRMNTAMNLLQDEHRSIADICNTIGYESPGSFSLLFRRKTGSTPMGYRSRMRQRREEVQQHPVRFVPHCFIESYGLGEKSKNQ